MGWPMLGGSCVMVMSCYVQPLRTPRLFSLCWATWLHVGSRRRSRLVSGTMAGRRLGSSPAKRRRRQDPTSAAVSGREHLDPFARVRLLADAYGADEETRREFTAVLMEIEEVALRFVMERVDDGVQAFVEMWNDLGGPQRHRRKMAWLGANLSRIDDALVV